MPTGDTFTNTLNEALDVVIAAARSVREYPHDIMINLVDRQTLEPGTGTEWREFAANQLTASNYGETDIIDDPQQIDGSILSGTPTLTAIQFFVGKRLAVRANPKAFAQIGQLAQNAIQRKKDIDGLAMFATASTTIAGAGVTLTSGHIRAPVERIASNATEPGKPPYYAVLHGYGIYDLGTELRGGVGTYPVPEGITQEAYRRGFSGTIEGAEVYRDGLITIDANDDARGGVFAGGPGGALVLIQGMAPWTETKPRPEKGYGGDDVFLKDEYIYIERSPGNWMFGVLHDATAMTS